MNNNIRNSKLINPTKKVYNIMQMNMFHIKFIKYCQNCRILIQKNMQLFLYEKKLYVIEFKIRRKLLNNAT